MLTGDDLSIQLFIAGTAIAVMGIAVTQAGWTHKWFVWSLFVIALGLGLCAIYWRQIREANPEIGAWASGIAGNSVSWFTLLFIGLGAVFILDFLARIGWLRTTVKREAMALPSPIEPVKPGHTISAKAETPPAERFFVSANAQTLMAFYDGRTSIQADLLTKPYLGKWIFIQDKVSNTGSRSSFVFVSVYKGDAKTISLVFDKSWEDRISILMAGDSFKALGRIASVDAMGMRLEDCELVL